MKEEKYKLRVRDLSHFRSKFVREIMTIYSSVQPWNVVTLMREESKTYFKTSEYQKRTAVAIYEFLKKFSARLRNCYGRADKFASIEETGRNKCLTYLHVFILLVTM
jgi:hypothetical protein